MAEGAENINYARKKGKYTKIFVSEFDKRIAKCYNGQARAYYALFNHAFFKRFSVF